MTIEPRCTPAVWTVETLRLHLEALRAADDRFQQERDRRYTEGNALRAEALRIKEEGDRRALILASEIQAYKDEKANELRSQIERERGSYATHPELSAAVDRIEALLTPLTAYVSAQQGTRALTPGGVLAGVGFLMTLFGLYTLLHKG